MISMATIESQNQVGGAMYTLTGAILGVYKAMSQRGDAGSLYQLAHLPENIRIDDAHAPQDSSKWSEASIHEHRGCHELSRVGMARISMPKRTAKQLIATIPSL
jgi:hypothetical protein